MKQARAVWREILANASSHAGSCTKGYVRNWCSFRINCSKVLAAWRDSWIRSWDMGSNRRKQESTHTWSCEPDHDERKRRHKWGCNPKRHSAKSTTKKDLCVRMPFLPKIYYYFNCFRTYRPPTRVWETISRAGWSSSADAADNPLFAHMPYLWNLRPEHQRIWANQKQAQTIEWPRVPPNAMACKIMTNDQFQLSCLLQLSAWKLSAGKQARKKKHLLEEKQHALEGQHNSQTAPTKSLTSLFDKFYCLLPLLLLLPPLLLLLLKPRTKSL